MQRYEPRGQHLPGLHGLRGVAACLVVIFHVAYIRPVPLPSALAWLMPDLHLAVHLFFVLSAMSLLHAHARHVGTDGWILAYVIRRFFRIAPLFYVMLLIWAPMLGTQPGIELLLNVTFLFNLHRQTFTGLVPAGWAVGVEMLFYATVPLLLLYVTTLRAAANLFFACLLVSLIGRLTLVQEDAATYEYAQFALVSNLAFFAAGVWTWKALPYVPHWRQLGWASLVLVTVFAIVTPIGAHRGAPEDLLWALPLAGLCAWQIVSPNRVLSSAVMGWLGERSFSIYLVHPLIVWVLGAQVFGYVYSIGLGFVGCCVVSLGLVLPVAGLTYRLIERPGQRLGGWLIQRVKGEAARPAL